MKKLLCFALFFGASYSFAQTNQINPTGNVGIGTTTPVVPLEVIGKSNLKGNVEIDSSVIIRDSIVVDRDARIKNDLRVDGKGVFTKNLRTKKNLIVKKNAKIKGDIIMENYADSIFEYGVLFLDEDGRTFPVTRSLFQQFVIENAYPDECLTFPNGVPANLPPIWNSASPNILHTGAGDCQTGIAVVGINQNQPGAFLHVRALDFSNNPTLNVLTLERKITGVLDPVLNIDKDGHVAFVAYENSNDANLFVIKNGTSGQTLLQLEESGLLRAREIKVDLASWPDYVFEEDYVLMPLSEVEDYIECNGHLPGVKSAKEIEQEGLNLADANKVLMEKMEEMTLYLIEMKKEIEDLKVQLKIKKD